MTDNSVFIGAFNVCLLLRQPLHLLSLYGGVDSRSDESVCARYKKIIINCYYSRGDD
jgi:hypothetical protein